MRLPALVLTAGLATRLRPLSLVRAKAALPVAGEPLVSRILRGLNGAGVTDAVLNLHHLPATITRRLGDGTDLGIPIRYSWESAVLGSAGGPRHALGLIGAPTFIIVNGDTLTDVAVGAVVDDHRRSGALVTLAVVPNREPQKYGGVVVDDDGRVSGFVGRGTGRPSWHFVGIQAAQADAFAPLPDQTPYESVARLYPELMASRPGSVRAFRTTGSFFDIGTPRDYLQTALALGTNDPAGTDSSTVDATARIIDSVCWDDVVVEAGVRLERCIVCDGARIPARTTWADVTLRPAGGAPLDAETRVGDLFVSPIG